MALQSCRLFLRDVSNSVIENANAFAWFWDARCAIAPPEARQCGEVESDVSQKYFITGYTSTLSRCAADCRRQSGCLAIAMDESAGECFQLNVVAAVAMVPTPTIRMRVYDIGCPNL